jgi:hypothetical protein
MNRTRTQLLKALLSAVGAALLLGSNTASANAERFELGITGGAHFVPFGSMDSIGDDRSYTLGGLQAGVRLPELPIIGGFTSEASIRWDTGTFSGTTFNRISADLDINSITTTGRLRRALLDNLSAFGEFGLGVQWGTLSLLDAHAQSSSRPLSGSDTAALTSIGGGFDFQFIRTPKLSFSLRSQLNYEATTSMTFSATPMSSGDELVIDTQAARMGSINASGPALRIGVVGSF